MLAGSLLLLTPAAARSATPAATPLPVVQLEFPIPLVASGDRVEMGYDTRGIPSATGFLYVRNDLRRSFTRVVMRRRKAEKQLVPSDGLRVLRAVVPASLLRGHKLFYYAVVRDPRTGQSVRVPAAGARAPEFVWVINRAGRVRLGAHRFGHPRAPEAAVARAGPGDVAFENPQEGARFGPWSFDVAPDRSIWLLDELNKRLLVWGPDRPDISERSVPLPFYPIDFTLGPAGSLYVTRQGPPGTPAIHLTRVASMGEVLWESTLDTEIFNSQLRTGPDGTLYWTAPGFSPRTERGSERRWTPSATPGGQPLSVTEQQRLALWGLQPVTGRLRLMEVWASAHEMRYALVDLADRLIRAWRVRSQTDITGVLEATPGLVGGDPVVIVEVTAGSGLDFRWEYVVLRLAPGGGTRARFSLSHAAWGDVITALRVGPDGKLYQLGSSPTAGIVINRFPLGPVPQR